MSLLRTLVLTSLAALALAPCEARAEGVVAEVHGSYRLAGWLQPDLPLGLRDLGAPRDMLGQTGFLEHRLRAGALVSYGDLSFDFELDALNGLLGVAAGDQVLAPIAGPEASPARADLADPLRNRAYGLSLNSLAIRKASLRWKTGLGLFSVGATVNRFGLGLLANGGDAPIDAELGDQRFGDRVLRASWATKPLQALGIDEDLTALAGADLLLQDETGTLVRPASDWDAKGLTRDVGAAFVLALRHVRGGYSSGLFFTHRRVTSPGASVLDPNVTAAFDTSIRATVVDLFADYKHPIGPPEKKREWFVAAEGAVVTGSTNTVRNHACPGNTEDNRCAILQFGAVARAGLRGERVSFDLLGGFASGDGNPFDASLTGFRFDRDFKAGLILFDQVLAWQTAAMVRRAGDPLLLNVPNAGLELASTSGAITNALFLQPTVRVQATGRLQLVASLLWARAPQAYLDPLWTNRTSRQVNPWGVEAGRSYGAEFDAGANYARELSTGTRLLVGLAGGYFVPGDAFATDAAGARIDPVWLVKARTAVTF
jgi:hypothetical protein